MKRMIIAAMVMSLLGCSLALADPPSWAADHGGRDHHEWHHDGHRDGHPDRRDHRDWRDHRDGRDHRDWRHDRRDHRDWRHDRREHRWGDFDDGHYRRPPGYRYRVWRHGERLPLAFRAPEYIVPDAAYYHLPPPPPGYYWVRVNHTAVLAAIATGIVLDVVANEFH